ncbi:lipopolysaccharide core heptose(II) kinase RfaY [Exiguobacterium oxidotolerans]|uniref:Putative serine/threonine-protein kinase YrzF n=1 Tax=Exiguobacterium oxidotolerans TaxID=223958 RepID=A0A653IH08_9BACL|nr:lipopolysaccharide core heptose(II) kinase RfaY [Exiguobacterium oxidotolerans]VWX38566.1 putative serine/threonine-protein kinase YrzF [Exiguobacterium oxidotolerans]
MKTDQELATAITIESNGQTQLITGQPPELDWIGTGRSAFVFRIQGTDRVIKKFFPSHRHLAVLEGAIYEQLSSFSTYAKQYAYGADYLVIEYIEGQTLFDCLVNGTLIPRDVIRAVDQALADARSVGLNPSDIHLRNIMLTKDGTRIIDVARFRQTEPCSQWDDLKRGYDYFYCKSYFPKKLPEAFLNTVADIYKRRMFESHRNTG